MVGGGCRARGGRMEGVIECGLVLVEFFGGIGGNRNGGWL